MHVAYQRVGTPRLPSCIEYATSQEGWRCEQKDQWIRAGFINPMFTCGSRLTCLSPSVVNGSREEAEVRYLLDRPHLLLNASERLDAAALAKSKRTAARTPRKPVRDATRRGPPTAAATEAEGASRGPCWPCCEVGHSHAVALARELSYQLIREANSTSYNVHGLFGIFASGDRINYTATGKHRAPHERPTAPNYGQVKTRFIYSRLCELSRSRSVSTVCEIGFNAGLSAILLLEATRSARVLSFDLGNFPWASRADELVREHYGSARFPGVVFGEAHTTLREQAAREQQRGRQLRCDAAFIDGAKSYVGRLQHIQDIRAVSRLGTRIFLDEITSRECVDGSLSPSDYALRCKRINGAYYDATRAYSAAVRRGMMRVLDCAWPPHMNGTDGICLAELL